MYLFHFKESYIYHKQNKLKQIYVPISFLLFFISSYYSYLEFHLFKWFALYFRPEISTDFIYLFEFIMLCHQRKSQNLTWTPCLYSLAHRRPAPSTGL